MNQRTARVLAAAGGFLAGLIITWLLLTTVAVALLPFVAIAIVFPDTSRRLLRRLAFRRVRRTISWPAPPREGMVQLVRVEGGPQPFCVCTALPQRPVIVVDVRWPRWRRREPAIDVMLVPMNIHTAPVLS